MEILTDLVFRKVGILLNIIGTILIAISIGRNPDGAYSPQIGGDKGLKDIATFNHLLLFKVGLGLIILGFFIELIS